MNNRTLHEQKKKARVAGAKATTVRGERANKKRNASRKLNGKKSVNAKSAANETEEPVKFFARHFWQMMETQDGRCALTGRELTPDNTEVELREPFKTDKRTAFSNHYLIVRSLAHTARYVDEKQIIELALDIVRFRGKEFGYELKKARK